MVVVGERYRLERELGTGGTATVWLAHDAALDRPVAVKLLLPLEPVVPAREGPLGPGSATRRERLKTEARALARLDHPNVVRIWDLGTHEGRDYIVMEYLERGSLADRLALDGAMAPAEAVQAVLQVLDALGAAHAAGIVHRDVKPGNVLVRDDGAVALCDFGIARTELGRATETGVALGSLGFMAPEQRLDARRAGPQADLYAAACTLFNLVTNDTPVDLYLAPDTSPRWDTVPQGLRAVLRRATRSEPSQRYADAAEMADTLRAVLPSVAGLPPARNRRSDSPLIGYVPTSVPPSSVRTLEPEPSVGAEHRVRNVEVEDWRWSTHRTPVGRPAVWVGLSVTAVFTALMLALGPLRPTSPEAAAPSVSDAPRALDPPAPPPPEVRRPLVPQGRWQGTFGEHPATLELHGNPSALTGELVVRLGKHELRSRLAGAVSAEGALVLTDLVETPSGATYVGRPNESGLILEGEMTREGEAPVPFALVRTE